MSSGYVYILMNLSMPDLVKIGLTTRTLDERITELSGATGVPTPCILIYRRFFENCLVAENKMHSLLSDYRLSNNREFFKIPVYEAIDALISLEDGSSGLPSKSDNDKKTKVSSLDEDLIVHAKNMFYGDFGELQDYTEAFNTFNKLASHNHPIALQYIGKMRLNGLGCRKNLNMAINNYNNGARHGNIGCYAELGSIYLLHEKLRNISLAFTMYNKYFELANEKLTVSEDILYIRKLLGYCLNQHVAVPNFFVDKIDLFKQLLLTDLHKEIDDINSNEKLDEFTANYLKEQSLKIISYLNS